MDECHQNQRILELLDIWEWCSKTLHVKWERRRKSRNSLLLALAYAISEPNFINPFQLTKVYQTLPTPLLNRKRIQSLWRIQPVPLLELGLGCYTKRSLLQGGLEAIRKNNQHNTELDKIAKKMRSREKRFGSDWLSDGHHPESEVLDLQKGTKKLCAEIRGFLLSKVPTIEMLTHEVLAQGPWQFGKLPASSYVRKTPETLLNRATRLKLWQTAQSILSRNLDEETALVALGQQLPLNLTPSVRAAIKVEGYSVDQVVDDVINFDMYKARTEITG